MDTTRPRTSRDHRLNPRVSNSAPQADASPPQSPKDRFIWCQPVPRWFTSTLRSTRSAFHRERPHANPASDRVRLGPTHPHQSAAAGESTPPGVIQETWQQRQQPPCSHEARSLPPPASAPPLSQAECYRQHIERPGAWLGQAALQAMADYLACDLQIWRQDSETAAVLDLAYPQSASAAQAPPQRTARLLFFMGHYSVITTQVEPKPERRDLQSLNVVEVGGEGDCGLLGFAYALNIDGFAHEHDAHQRLPLDEPSAEAARAAAYRTLRDQVALGLRLGLSSWLADRMEQYDEHLTLAAISDASDIMEMAATVLQHVEAYIACNELQRADDALQEAAQHFQDAKRLQNGVADASLSSLNEQFRHCRAQMLHAREVLIHRVEAPPSHSHLRHGCSEVAAKPTVGNAQVAQHFHAARLQLSTARTAAAQGDPRSAWQHAAAAASWLAAAQQLLGSNVQNNELDHLTEQVSALMSPGAAR